MSQLARRQAGGVPPRRVFSEFFWLFEERGADAFSDPSFESAMRLRGTYDRSIERFRSTKPIFKSYEAFLEKLEDECKTRNRS